LRLWQAAAYFVREAALNMARGWRVTLLAVFTIAVSLFVGGVFLLVSSNLTRAVAAWRQEARLVVYLRPDTSAEDRARVRQRIAASQWVRTIDEVDSERARERFRTLFPSMGDLVEGWTEDPLPPSFEVAYDPVRAPGSAFGAWVGSLRSDAAVSVVDDDRDWLRQLETVIAVVRGVGLALGGILLGAAIFTIASVIRLTAYLYSEEIAILRLVGGTEFFIRGPFYAEGLLEGLFGGGLAAAALWAAFAAVRPQAGSSLMAWLFAGTFLPWQEVGGLILLGAAAGLAGAIVSLRREALGEAPES
jgi:cell division transport system permease protein